MTWTRLARRLRPDYNPLRRRSDLVQAWLVPAVIAAFLILGPLVAMGAIAVVHGHDAADWNAERSLRTVPAVVLTAVPGPMESENPADTWLTWARARWSFGGQEHVGMIPAPAGTRAEATVRVWLDRAGHVRLPPLSADTARDRVIVTTAMAVTGLAGLLACAGAVVGWVLNRRRLAAWDVGWRQVEPEWSHLK